MVMPDTSRQLHELTEGATLYASQRTDQSEPLNHLTSPCMISKEEVGLCPKCGVGNLLIIRSPKTGKRFVGCSEYKEGGCDQTFPLPQKGTITPLGTQCPHCGHHMVKVISGRRTWETCVNWTECPGRQADLKALEKKREKANQAKQGDSSNE